MRNYGACAAGSVPRREGGGRARSFLVSLAVMCAATAAVTCVVHWASGDRVQLLAEPPGARRAAARGRTRQARIARTSRLGTLKDLPSSVSELGVAGAAAGVGDWMTSIFPGSFLAHGEEEGEHSEHGATNGCSCEEKRCFICLHEGEHHGGHGGEEHGEHGGHEGEQHGDHGGEEHGEHDAHGDGGNATAHHEKSFDKQMLRFAVSGLSEADEEHEEHNHEEYHPIVFVNYVNKCCPHPKMETVTSGESDSRFDQPCYWDEDELEVDQWKEYGHAVVCTKSDFKEAHTLVNTLDTWAIALACFVWMAGLVLLHNCIHDLLHGGHGHDGHGDGHGNGEEMDGHGDDKRDH